MCRVIYTICCKKHFALHENTTKFLKKSVPQSVQVTQTLMCTMMGDKAVDG